MKVFKFLPFVVVLFALGSCTNNEYAYNEKVASLFLGEMNKLDDTQKSFADSATVLHADASTQTILNTKAENAEHNAQQDIQNMLDLKPSDAAKEFHEGVISYFAMIKNYCITAKELLAAKAGDKPAIYEKLMAEYKLLNKMPDQLLVIQKQYLNKVGLKPKQ